jgi:hypothetical protein
MFGKGLFFFFFALLALSASAFRGSFLSRRLSGSAATTTARNMITITNGEISYATAFLVLFLPFGKCPTSPRQ